MANALGCDFNYDHPSDIMDEIARLTPTFNGVSYERLDQWAVLMACNAESPEGTPFMHSDGFVRGEGFFAIAEYVATEERANRGIRYYLQLGAYCLGTMLAHRHGAPITASGMRRTAGGSSPC